MSIQQWPLTHFKLSDFTLAAAIFILLFGDVLQNQVDPIFRYVDATFLILFSISASVSLLSPKTRSVTKSDIAYGLLTLLFLSIGVVSSIRSGLQPHFEAVLIDFASCARFALAFLLMRVLLRKECRAESVLELTTRFARIAAYILFIAVIANIFLDLGMNQGYRFGIPSFAFLFGHPTNLAAAVVALVAILAMDLKRNVQPLVLSLLVLVATLRFKAIGFALVIALLLFFVSTKRKRIPWLYLILAGLGALLMAWEQIALYFGNVETARSVLLSTSVEVANDWFPWGTGYATFGSPASATFYVDFYYTLGFDRVFGLAPGSTQYLADSFWPIVFAQFGWIGTAVFILSLFILISIVSKAIKLESGPVWALLAIPIYLLVSSTSEPAFFSSYSVSLALVLAVVVSQKSAKTGISNSSQIKFQLRSN